MPREGVMAAPVGCSGWFGSTIYDVPFSGWATCDALRLAKTHATIGTVPPATTSRYKPIPMSTDSDKAAANGLSSCNCAIRMLKSMIFHTPISPAIPAGRTTANLCAPVKGNDVLPIKAAIIAGANNTRVIQPSPLVPATAPMIGAWTHGRKVATMPRPAAIRIASRCLWNPPPGND